MEYMKEWEPIKVKLLGKDIEIHEHSISQLYELAGMSVEIRYRFHINESEGSFGKKDSVIFDVRTTKGDRRYSISHMFGMRRFYEAVNKFPFESLDHIILRLLFSDEFCKLIIKELEDK